MTAQAVIQKQTEKAGSAAEGRRSDSKVRPDYRTVPRNSLQPSATNPRRRMIEQSLESLAASIRSQGVLEPLIVRQKEGKYEIVCGERRYRAAGIAGTEELPCLIRELTDEQVLDIQIHENLHREDLHPMDEAYGYQFLREKLNCDIKELSLRVGKSEGYVLNRLKLNLLIKEAQEDIDEGHLPLVYALEIAKYSPDIQSLIYGEVYRKEGRYEGDEYVLVVNKEQIVPFKVFAEWISTNVHRLLSKAPFDPKATNLHPEGLACIKCPERTGAAVSLFEPDRIGKKDSCLNPTCFKSKLHAFIEVQRDSLAKEGKIEASGVPLVRSRSYVDGEDYFGGQSAKVISGTKRPEGYKPCRKSVSGIDLEADNFGQTVSVCLRSSGCKTHWPEVSVSSPATGSRKQASEADVAAERLDAHRLRREEIWNAKVAEAVRIRVFKEAAEKFEKKFRLTDVGTDFLSQLLARFWQMSVSGDSNNLNCVVKHLLAEWLGENKQPGDSSIPELRISVDRITKLERGMQYRLLFLLIHGNKGTIGYNNNYSSQKEVKELALEFQADYTLIDAEVRLQLSGSKHKEVHEAYLKAVKDKREDVVIPRPYSDKWKSGD